LGDVEFLEGREKRERQQRSLQKKKKGESLGPNRGQPLFILAGGGTRRNPLSEERGGKKMESRGNGAFYPKRADITHTHS